MRLAISLTICLIKIVLDSREGGGVNKANGYWHTWRMGITRRLASVITKLLRQLHTDIDYSFFSFHDSGFSAAMNRLH